MGTALARLEIPGWRSQWRYSPETLMYDVRVDGYPKCSPADRFIVLMGVSMELRHDCGISVGDYLASQCEGVAESHMPSPEADRSGT